MGTSDFLFHIPLNILVSYPVREKNADYAVAQAKGKLEFLIEMLDELKAIENKEASTWSRDEVIAKIVGHYEDLWLISIEEAKYEAVEVG